MDITRDELKAELYALINDFELSGDIDLFCQEVNRVYQVYLSFGIDEPDEEPDQDYREAIYNSSKMKKQIIN